MCASGELRRYLNRSLRNVPPFFRSCHLADSQPAASLTDWLAGWLSGRWQGWGCVAGGELKVMCCLKFRSDERRHGSKMRLCPRGKITVVLTRGHSCRCDVLRVSEMMEVNNLHRR